MKKNFLGFLSFLFIAKCVAFAGDWKKNDLHTESHESKESKIIKRTEDLEIFFKKTHPLVFLNTLSKIDKPFEDDQKNISHIPVKYILLQRDLLSKSSLFSSDFYNQPFGWLISRYYGYFYLEEKVLNTYLSERFIKENVHKIQNNLLKTVLRNQRGFEKFVQKHALEITNKDFFEDLWEWEDLYKKNFEYDTWKRLFQSKNFVEFLKNDLSFHEKGGRKNKEIKQYLSHKNWLIFNQVFNFSLEEDELQGWVFAQVGGHPKTLEEFLKATDMKIVLGLLDGTKKSSINALINVRDILKNKKEQWRFSKDVLGAFLPKIEQKLEDLGLRKIIKSKL